MNTCNLQNNRDFLENQRAKVYCYLQDHIATASMVEIATGVHHKNVCRYKRELEKAGMLAELEKKTCERTGYKAYYLTTNPALFPDRPVQTSLF